MVTIVGMDFAWSGRYPTGICVLEERTHGLLATEVTTAVLPADEAAAWLSRIPGGVVAGIDAPLIATDSRRAEAELARTYGKYGIFAYAARPAFLEAHGIAHGPALGRLLADAGWSLDPAALGKVPGLNVAIEVFPHAISVSLLGADRALKYKRGRLAVRAVALAELQRLLRRYCERALPSALPGLQEVLGASPLALRGTALKDLEDRLDAIACAFAAHHMWANGAAGIVCFGDAVNGYIAVPKTTFVPARSFP